MPLKLGLVTGEFPPKEGGVGAFTQELARALHQGGHIVHIITDRSARTRAARGRLRELKEPVDLSYATLHPCVRNWRWPSLSEVADVILRHELDLVNIQYQAAAYNMRSPAINFLPWRLKGITKCVVTFHDLRVPYLFPKAGRLRELAVKFMARQAHAVITTNAADLRDLQRQLPEEAHLEQIPIGSNIVAMQIDEAAVQAVRERMRIESGDCLIGYFGFLNESKGADLLLAALDKLDEKFKLVFIGGKTGSSDAVSNRAFSETLADFIARQGLSQRIHHTSYVAQSEVSTHLRAADIIVMPYRDGASLRRGTLMATLAHGRPLITTEPVVPIPELTHRRNAYFVPQGDAEALAEAIEAVASDYSLRKDLEKGAAEAAELFTWDKIAARSASFFAKVIDNSADVAHL